MKRVALFVGVNQYEDPGISPLNCAVNDARELAGLFRHKLGFQTELLTDVELGRGKSISRMVRELGRGLSAGDTFVFFFAGHGKTTTEPDDQIFLLPEVSRAALDSGVVAGEGSLSWRALRAETDRWQGVQRLFIFDACRSPLETEQASHRSGDNLARFSGEIVYRDIGLRSTQAANTAALALINSCADGERAEELAGYPGGRGLFSAAFGEVIETRRNAGKPLSTGKAFGEELAQHMRQLVRKYEQRDSLQRPFVTGGEIELLQKQAVAEAPIPASEPAAPASVGRSYDERKWLQMLDDLEFAGSAEEKIALLKSHTDDPSISGCVHDEEVRARIRALRQENIAQRQANVLRVQAEADEQAHEAQRQADASAWQLAENIVRASSNLDAKVAAYRAYSEQWSAQRVEALARIGELERQIRETQKHRAQQLRQEEERQSEQKRREEEARRKDPRYFKPSRAGEAVTKLCPEAPEMVAIPPGKFLMGSPENELGRCDTESPQHEVHIDYWLAAGQYAVTFEEWDRFAAETGGYRPEDSGWGRGMRPVINVSWEDAQAYLAWLNRMAGLSANDPTRYRLLSEAEWEYACRAGTNTAFWCGNSINTNQANYDGNYIYNGGPKGEHRMKTLPVDSFTPNPWGLYQTHGNVWEWVEDGCHLNYDEAPRDGSAWVAYGNQRLRMLRGGSWNFYPRISRSANRDYLLPTDRDNYIGFRLARTLL